MDIEKGLREAVRFYWDTRLRQKKDQGSASGEKDYGNRAAVTGGAQADGFIRLIKGILAESGLPDASIHSSSTTLPGYFRPTKEWDLIVVVDGTLLASVEFKTQAGPSFGNNFNNRVEEALGNATDLWTAFREGAFKVSQKPWLGYFMMLEEHRKSINPVSFSSPHFRAFEVFSGASYARRYQIFCERLVRERLYDATCFILSSRDGGLKGEYTEPNTELSFKNFSTSLMGRAIAYMKNRP
jgi:hypothetical protein